MDKINELINYSILKWAIKLRWTIWQDNDIDLFIDKSCLYDIKNEWIRLWYFILKEDEYKLTFWIFINMELFIIDYEFSFEYVFNLFNNKINYDLSFINKYISNPNDKKNKLYFNITRYLLMFRYKNKYINYLNNNKKYIFLWINNSLWINIFKKNDWIDIYKFIKKK